MAVDPDKQAIDAYVEMATAGREADAHRVVDEALARGMQPEAVYLSVLVPAQQKIGDRWLNGELSVAIEHLATEITLRVMEHLRNTGIRKPPLRKRVVVACAPGDRHSLGAKMVADFLYLDGWTVDFLGADVPASDLAGFVSSHPPDLVALSIFQDEFIDPAREAIAAVQALKQGIALMIGGRAVSGLEEAHRIGAQGYAADASEAVAVARALVGVSAGLTLDQLLQIVGERVLARRRALGWSQQQVASAADLDRTYISTVENGRQNLTLSALLRLANALDVSVAELITDRPAD